MKLALGFAFVFVFVACGPSVPREELMTRLHSAMETPVNDAEQAAQRSRVVQDAVDADALQGLRRFEIQEELGRGDPCSRHPRCGELGFDGDAWFYNVGEMGEGYPGPVPALIVGFDRQGIVVRVWNLRLHE